MLGKNGTSAMMAMAFSLACCVGLETITFAKVVPQSPVDLDSKGLAHSQTNFATPPSVFVPEPYQQAVQRLHQLGQASSLQPSIVAEPNIFNGQPLASKTKNYGRVQVDGGYGANGQARPRIGVVFGGGGAAGVCHVGVLKVLEEYGIPVDCVCGTSMGAIVAGLYSTGMSADELEQIVCKFDWDEVLNESPKHSREYERRKSDDYLFPPALSVGVQDGEVNLGQGFVSSQYLTASLRRLLARSNKITNFDNLPIPFRTLATDLESGEVVVFRGGNMATAIRASMSIPGVFPPVRVGGRTLVDGGVRNNVPTELAREMGADILIVVALPSVLKKSEDLKSSLSIMGQSLTIVRSHGTANHPQGLTQRDILVKPNMNGIGTLDFDRVREAVQLGADATRQYHQELLQLSKMVQASGPVPMPIPLPERSSFVADSIQINNRSGTIPNAAIASRLSVQPGVPFNLDQLDSDIARIYGTKQFGSVDYEMTIGQHGQNGLKINTLKDSRGDNLLTLGIGLEDDFSGDAFYSAAVNMTRRNLTANGGEVRLFGQIGSRQRAILDFYQPLNVTQSLFVRPYFEYIGFNQPVFFDQNRLADVTQRQATAGVEVGKNVGDFGLIAAGIFGGATESSLKVGDPLSILLDKYQATSGVYLSIKHDSLDSYFLPKNGLFAEVRYTNFDEKFGNDVSTDKLAIRLIGAKTRGRHTLIARVDSVAGAFATDETAVGVDTPYGGFLRMSGFSRNQILSERRTHLALVHMRHLADAAGKHVSFYTGASGEVGVFDDGFDIPENRAIAGGSLFFAADTPLGPFFAGFGINDDGESGPFIAMGQVF